MIVYRLEKVETHPRLDFWLSIDEFTLKGGRVCAVIGPNGCGKSTLLNILAFADTPASGRVEFMGREVGYANGEVLSLRRQVAYLMQDPYLFNMSVEDNIRYGLKIRGVRKAEAAAAADRVMRLLSLSHLANRSAHALSGGEAQRVAIARTVVLDSSVVLLDEPTANVDKKNIGAIEELMTSLAREQGATVVFTTHSQGQAERLSDITISMEGGRVVDHAGGNLTDQEASNQMVG